MAKLAVPVTKGKSSVEIDTDALPEDVYKEALLQGLKVLVNRGMSKITKATHSEEEMKSEAMIAAEKNVEAIMTSKIKFTGGAKASKVSGAVKTEAMRLARNLVKDEMKKAGMKISHVDAKDITAAAKELLEGMPELVETAKKNLEDRAAIPLKGINISAIPINPDKKAKAEAKKKDQLSAKQAGKVQVRKKGQSAEATA